ncbi:MAG: alpha-glucuronidase [Opitutaceae bacterium]|nr:alpha-glucuronidase [Opitutaceae bacterium]
MKCFLLVLACALAAPLAVRGEDGYRLWLRYEPVASPDLRRHYVEGLTRIVLATPTGAESPVLAAARMELREGLDRMLGANPTVRVEARAEVDPAAGSDGYQVTVTKGEGGPVVTIAAARDIGVLYGAFALLRHLQMNLPLSGLATVSAPRISQRIMNHWDNLNRFVERGYAGFSLWDWYQLPEVRDRRYRDYARALASLGLNGTVLNNVNANALILTPDYLKKVAALADEFRPYGIRVYLSARFSAPIEIGGLKTADPQDPAVIAWWRAKVEEIYTLIPDFGGFLVKANSEGQPGPHEYGRTHADGANLFADALAPHGGLVLWRAFVYAADNSLDRVRQAYRQFTALDGQFRDNVLLQIKNGPLDFMPREPFHPLFGAMPRTRLAIELQITQEYLGGATHLAYLAPMWKEVLDSDTFAKGPNSTVARVVDGRLRPPGPSVISGVANTGNERNWTGHPLAAANWYAFGRLAWDHQLTSQQIAEEWARMTFGANPRVSVPITRMLLGSREIVVNYSMPLGLHHIMAEGHHFGPGPWVVAGRPDWSSNYYHQADERGLGAARGPAGSNALADYAPELAARWGNPATCPDELLLWFHHLPWDHRMRSGRILWDELAVRYQQGVEGVRGLQQDWDALLGLVDDERFQRVKSLLRRQESDARDWRDACLLYFQQYSHRPLPEGVESPAHDLATYQARKLRYAPGHPGDY